MGRYKWVVMGKSPGRAASLRLDSLEGPGSTAKRQAGRVAGPSQKEQGDVALDSSRTYLEIK